MEQNRLLGWLGYTTETEAETTIQQINNCLGFPTEDGKTLTWTNPYCIQNGYSPTATTQNYYVIIKNQCFDCLTEEQKSEIKDLPVGWYDCGTTSPITGSTENNL